MNAVLKPAAIAILAATMNIISGSGLPVLSFQYSFMDTKEDIFEKPKEDIILNTDRDRYIAGEQIWFSIATIDSDNGTISSLSSLAYVELLNPWNQAVIQSRFSLTEGLGKGYFQLPDSLSSGKYTVRAYTNHMKNFLPEVCFMHDLEIYNAFSNQPFREKTSHSSTDANRSGTAESVPIQGPVDILTDSIYGRREKVTMKISTGLSEGSNLSISVVPSGYTVGNQLMIRHNTPEKTGNERYGFEKERHRLTLKVKYREKSSADSSRYLFRSVQGKVAEFSYAERDSAGSYSFLLPVDNISRNFIIQPQFAGENMSLEIEPSFSWLLPTSTSFSAQLPDSILEIFSKMSFNYQASRIYNAVAYRKKPAPANSQARKRRFYGIPEMEVKLKDYISLPTMQEVFFELLPGIIIRPVKIGYEMRITNPLTGSFYAEPPLVMIDGIIINDLNVLADLNPEIVERIEVVKTPYLTGDLILHGIVNVITKTGNFSEISMPDYAVMLPYRVAEEVPDFAAPEYSDQEARMSRTPDLRNTLYWNPLINTGKSGEAVVSFWTSDMPGTYIFNVHGISDSGKRISIRKSFIVR
jgi:hypothetical protein